MPREQKTFVQLYAHVMYKSTYGTYSSSCDGAIVHIYWAVNVLAELCSSGCDGTFLLRCAANHRAAELVLDPAVSHLLRQSLLVFSPWAVAARKALSGLGNASDMYPWPSCYGHGL